MVTVENMLEVEIEPGMMDGQETKFIAEGEPHIDGEPGDLIFKIKTLPHSIVPSLFRYSCKIVIEKDKVTWPGAKIRKKDEGMLNYDNNNLHGYLIITIDIQFPSDDFSAQDIKDFVNILSQSSINKVYNCLNGY